MKAEELRIGNWVSNNAMWQSSIMEFQIKSLLPHKVTTSNGLTLKYVSLCGIPLTEEWLVKFGFERRVFTQRKEYVLIIDIDNQKHFIEFAFPRNEKIEVIMYYDKSFYKHIQYVHQLQNLYFALTGNELTTN